MGIMFGILALAALLSLVLLVHEAGHYAAARLVRAPLTDVRIGIGPQLLHWHDRYGVEWRLRAIPLIAWVSLHLSARDTLSAPARLLFVLAGPAASIVFGMIALMLHGSVLSMLAGDTAGAGVGDGLRSSIAVLAGMAHDLFDLLARTLTGAGLDMPRPIPSPMPSGPFAVSLVRVAGLMSLGVGAFNLLPLPGLDGAQAISATAEWLAGRRVAARVEAAMLWLALAGLVGLVAFWPARPAP